MHDVVDRFRSDRYGRASPADRARRLHIASAPGATEGRNQLRPGGDRPPVRAGSYIVACPPRPPQVLKRLGSMEDRPRNTMTLCHIGSYSKSDEPMCSPFFRPDAATIRAASSHAIIYSFLKRRDHAPNSLSLAPSRAGSGRHVGTGQENTTSQSSGSPGTTGPRTFREIT